MAIPADVNDKMVHIVISLFWPENTYPRIFMGADRESDVSFS